MLCKLQEFECKYRMEPPKMSKQNDYDTSVDDQAINFFH